MADEETESLAAEFEKVQNHLAYVNQTLDKMADEINDVVDDVISETSVELTYELDTGSFSAELPFDTVVSRLNERLNFPFFAKVENGELIIKDVRREYDLTESDLESYRSDGIENLRIKGIISIVESDHKNGAPREIIEYLVKSQDLAIEDFEEELTKLMQKGEVYEPANGFLRTT